MWMRRLPLPIAGGPVIAVSREPAFVTFINPEPIKGVLSALGLLRKSVAGIRSYLSLWFKSRRTDSILLATALEGRFELRHSNIQIAQPVPDPRRVYGVTRVLLIPSVEEAAGQVAAEALLNGVCPCRPA